MSTWQHPVYPADPEQMYALLRQQLKALLDGETDFIAAMANTSALIFQALPKLNWAGFYRYTDGMLVLGPFQGMPACTSIPMGRGVCGTAAQTRQVQLVPDVELFPGHIACDSLSRSELVIPLVWRGELLGVLDMDSPEVGRFTETDRKHLTELMELLLSCCGDAALRR